MKPRILILSSSLLIDRVLRHTNILDSLAAQSNVAVWTTSSESRNFPSTQNVEIEQFPAILAYREFPYNYMRRFNEFVWDYRHRPPSRVSMMRHVDRKGRPLRMRIVKGAARAFAALGKEEALELRLQRLLASYNRSPEASARLQLCRADVVVCTGPFWFNEPAVIAQARLQGIRTVAFIPSWDNISTKNRMVFQYDAYLVWSEQIRKELLHAYPDARKKPVYVVGAPQFDVFFDRRFYETREQFCERYGLRSDLPVLLYAIGSPNFLQEHHAALHLADCVCKGMLGDVQILVRPHPLHDNGTLTDRFRKYMPRVVVQRTADPQIPLLNRSQDEDQVIEWVNTFRHADVVVNLSSTVTVDASIFDRPVVNLDFDPEPGRPNQQLVEEVNHVWTHFKPVAESGGVWLVKNYDELLEAIRVYLDNPEKHRAGRRWIAEHVCQYLDGQSSKRMADAILDFAGSNLEVAAG